jgi:hypothetical protein
VGEQVKQQDLEGLLRQQRLAGTLGHAVVAVGLAWGMLTVWPEVVGTRLVSL